MIEKINMANELIKIEEKIKKEVLLKTYKGLDRIILAKDKWEEIQEEKKNIPQFRAKTGILDLDNCTEGFRKGQLVVLSGPPKNGKTAINIFFTKSFIKQNINCLWLQYELSYDEFLNKFEEDEKIPDFYIPNYMDSGNLEWIENKIVEAKAKFNTEIVFIDHLDFLRDPNVLKGISLNLSAYVGGIMQKIKRMAVEHNVVIFLMSHITKNKWTNNKLPSAEDLRDSGQIAQLADMVLMIMRKRSGGIYEGNSVELGIIENRFNGKTKKIPLIFQNGEFVKEEIKRAEDYEEGFNEIYEEWNK